MESRVSCSRESRASSSREVASEEERWSSASREVENLGVAQLLRLVLLLNLDLELAKGGAST